MNWEEVVLGYLMHYKKNLFEGLENHGKETLCHRPLAENRDRDSRTRSVLQVSRRAEVELHLFLTLILNGGE
jgi:hypothetical protein